MRRVAHPLPAAPGTGYHRLSVREHRWAFDELIAPTLLRKSVFRPDPLVVYLVGESGAQELETRRMLRRAMRPGAVLQDPDLLRGTHPEHFQLVRDTPRIADERVRPDAQDWQAEAEAYVRGRRGDLLIAADYTSAADFAVSAGRSGRLSDPRGGPGRTRRRQPADQLGRACPGLQIDVMTALPTRAVHARACRAADDSWRPPPTRASARFGCSIATIRSSDGTSWPPGPIQLPGCARVPPRRPPASTPSSAGLAPGAAAAAGRNPRHHRPGAAADARPVAAPTGGTPGGGPATVARGRLVLGSRCHDTRPGSRPRVRATAHGLGVWNSGERVEPP
ncbi:zeta toxin family protein [Streptomyces lasalocidi]